jgi:hypothetical protein
MLLWLINGHLLLHTWKRKKGHHKFPPHTIEDMYTAVMKNPSYNPVTLDNAESSPSISPYIVEELYTCTRRAV